MLKIVGTVFSHDVFGISYVIHNVVAEENIVIHFIDVELIHTIQDAVDVNSEKVASGEQFAVVIRLFFDSFPLDIIAFKKEKDTDEGYT